MSIIVNTIKEYEIGDCITDEDWLLPFSIHPVSYRYSVDKDTYRVIEKHGRVVTSNNYYQIMDEGDTDLAIGDLRYHSPSLHESVLHNELRHIVNGEVVERTALKQLTYSSSLYGGTGNSPLYIRKIPLLYIATKRWTGRQWVKG